MDHSVAQCLNSDIEFILFLLQPARAWIKDLALLEQPKLLFLSANLA